MFPAPLMVFDADAFVERPIAAPKFNAAVTVNAFADVAGLFSEMRTTKLVPATYVLLPVWYVGAPVIVNAACALMLMLNALLGPALNARLDISSVPDTDAVIDNDWVVVPAVIVIKKSIYPAPRIVLDADAFAVTPATRPFNVAVTVNALAFVAGLFDSKTRTTKVVPATYVPLPVWNVGALVIANAACALMKMPNAALGPALSARLDISSVPVTDAVIDSGWVAVPAVIVIKKSIYPAPRIVLDADAFAVTPATSPLNVAVTVCAFAFVAGLFVNETRKTKVVPATYVPFPVWTVGAPLIANAACALMVMPNEALGPALSARAVISSLPVTDAVIDSDWLVVPAVIVIRKSIYPTPLIIFDAEAFAVTPATSPANTAVTVNAFADVAGLFNETRKTNVVPATYVLLPVR